MIERVRPGFGAVDNWIILEGYRGSVAHETFLPNEGGGIDDIDTIGIAVPPLKYYFGVSGFEQTEFKVGEWDTVIYEIRKYVRLLMKANPNVLGLLWLKPEYYLKTTPLGNRLIAARDMFLSKAVYRTFVGYAHGQLKRMTHISGPDNAGKGYMGAKRKALAEKHGIDTKNAGHLIRILTMGVELLRTGYLHVHRGEIDAEYLKSIKRGELSLTQIQEKADQLFVEIEEARESSVLPEKADVHGIEKLLVEIITERANMLPQSNI